MKLSKPVKLILAILLSLSAGFIGSFFTASSVSTWYQTLAKPSFNPPSWVFGPVWTTLYILMGVTLYLIWTKKKNVQAERWFYLQLILNAAWSIIFFGLRSPMFAFFEIILLWLTIIGVIYWTSKTTKTGAYLMIPYLLWVTFASVLNFYIYLLN